MDYGIIAIVAFFVMIIIAFAWALPQEEIKEIQKRFKKKIV
jgi:hypothetical protein